MGIIAKFCGVITAFAAINWIALGMFETDALRATIGSGRTPATDGIAVVVGLSALYLLLQVIGGKKKKA